ncbi:ark-1, partial [Symbiodinium pilosum]
AFWNTSLLHRDLAARNVLVFSLDPPLVKLTDFGLVSTAGLERYGWPKGHAMGTRWMAPESQPDADFHFDDKRSTRLAAFSSNWQHEVHLCLSRALATTASRP